MSRATRVLAIGGIDSSGRAGLDADRDAAGHFGAELEAFASAETVQDDRGVHAVVPCRFWWYDAGYAI